MLEMTILYRQTEWEIYVDFASPIQKSVPPTPKIFGEESKQIPHPILKNGPPPSKDEESPEIPHAESTSIPQRSGE